MIRNMRYVVLAAAFAALTGCATTAQQLSMLGNDTDGAIRQKVEFRDLSAEEQGVIVSEGASQ